ncbi:RNA recognition motif family protein [Theileria parva strain Muguga]|uniref:RRM domain-containing protein n=1 Tax=Theileria parva TaxID=5875 RepID=Q4N1L1_THEPA|nr:RNA recognition motif family protein [Theileria parva strain Muguga]EAN32077.1 RNA recognition motif family protein [Theileria parva strain Muguga]|eukprot:XP_764360.1 hypothetical protein [Theileria parva strain Muguga]
MEEKREDEECAVYVYPLTKNLTSEHLREIFGHFGKLKDVELNKSTKEHSEDRYGVVYFEKYGDAKFSILHLDQGEIDGTKVKVTLTKPNY